MKNKKIFYLLVTFLFLLPIALFANEIILNATKIKIDKVKQITILEGDVNAKDSLNNNIFTNYATYNKKKEVIKTSGETKVVTSEGFILKGTNIIFDNNKRIISSREKAEILDKDGNTIFVEMFDYMLEKKFIFSKGDVKLIDINSNEYFFSEMYIDEKKNKIIGSDVKVFLNDKDFKQNSSNEPRFFANTLNYANNIAELNKASFTFCEDKGEDTCPPWSILSKKISHDSAKKTIYYDNAVLKIYDFPIFFFPKFNHPDPTVSRRSGFMPPSMSSSTLIGTGIQTPYYWALAEDRDLLISPKIYSSENPLLMTEYRQAFNNSFLTTNIGVTKNDNSSKSYFFSKFTKSIKGGSNINSKYEINLQSMSEDNFIKDYDINASLFKDDIQVLKNTFNYQYRNDDLFLNADLSAFDNIVDKQNKKDYEYLLPHITLKKDIFSNSDIGLFDLESNFKIRNYDENKQVEFFVNDINFKSNKTLNLFGVESQYLGGIKATQYNAQKTVVYKDKDDNSELSGGVGYLGELNLYKNNLIKKNNHLLTPKLLLRYSPSHMRSLTKTGYRLNYDNLFEFKKFNELDVFENGLSASIGFDYQKNKLDKNENITDEVFAFSIGQVVSDSENDKLPSRSSMDQRFSDVVGASKLNLSDNMNINYKFSLDQNYNEFNYNEVGSDFTIGKAKFNLSYLEEGSHIGSTEYVKSDIEFQFNNSGILGFKAKRNLLTNSAEFYNMSYEYLNDCLRAGIVFRREFYNDKSKDPEDTLLFTIAVIPFGEAMTDRRKND